MHWGAVEVLTLIAGVITAGGFLVVPEATNETRLVGVGGGALGVLYAIWAASQTSGIIVIPVGVWAGAMFTLMMLYQANQTAQRRRANPPVPADTPGARQCLGCGQAFSAETPGPCPACHGTLASIQGKEQ